MHKHITPRILCRSTFAFLVHFHNPSSSKETKVTRFHLKLKIFLKLTHFLQTQKPLLSNFKRFWLETNIIKNSQLILKKIELSLSLSNSKFKLNPNSNSNSSFLFKTRSFLKHSKYSSQFEISPSRKDFTSSFLQKFSLLSFSKIFYFLFSLK